MQADAAKSGNKGGPASGAITVAPGMELYQLTEHGLALQANIQGTKYYRDTELNVSAKTKNQTLKDTLPIFDDTFTFFAGSNSR